MSKRLCSCILVLIIVSMIFNTGCSRNKNIAYISANTNSEYNNTFKELNLGTFFDFNLKLLNADKSWVTIWVEAYSNGKAVKPDHIIELSYGLSPEKVMKGHMGFGILNYNAGPKVFIISNNIRTNFKSIDDNLLSKDLASSSGYTIGSKLIGIEPGKEVILAVYNQVKGSTVKVYDYKDSNSIKQIINESATVLLLKIKVEKKEKL